MYKILQEAIVIKRILSLLPYFIDLFKLSLSDKVRIVQVKHIHGAPDGAAYTHCGVQTIVKLRPRYTMKFTPLDERALFSLSTDISDFAFFVFERT